MFSKHEEAFPKRPPKTADLYATLGSIFLKKRRRRLLPTAKPLPCPRIQGKKLGYWCSRPVHLSPHPFRKISFFLPSITALLLGSTACSMCEVDAKDLFVRAQSMWCYVLISVNGRSVCFFFPLSAGLDDFSSSTLPRVSSFYLFSHVSFKGSCYCGSRVLTLFVIDKRSSVRV